ncbi:hypothetical protein KBD34_04705 [Patescibacteria group bacterium]|nr:hypothetical protein [Patescibacteria group bacterium]
MTKERVQAEDGKDVYSALREVLGRNATFEDRRRILWFFPEGWGAAQEVSRLVERKHLVGANSRGDNNSDYINACAALETCIDRLESDFLEQRFGAFFMQIRSSIDGVVAGIEQRMARSFQNVDHGVRDVLIEEQRAALDKLRATLFNQVSRASAAMTLRERGERGIALRLARRVSNAQPFDTFFTETTKNWEAATKEASTSSPRAILRTETYDSGNTYYGTLAEMHENAKRMVENVLENLEDYLSQLGE